MSSIRAWTQSINGMMHQLAEEVVWIMLAFSMLLHQFLYSVLMMISSLIWLESDGILGWSQDFRNTEFICAQCHFSNVHLTNYQHFLNIAVVWLASVGILGLWPVVGKWARYIFSSTASISKGIFGTVNTIKHSKFLLFGWYAFMNQKILFISLILKALNQHSEDTINRQRVHRRDANESINHGCQQECNPRDIFSISKGYLRN